MFREAMNVSEEDENMGGEQNNDQLGNGVLGSIDVDRNYMP